MGFSNMFSIIYPFSLLLTVTKDAMQATKGENRINSPTQPYQQ